MSYPSVDRYLAQLPDGLQSYPDVQAKGSVFLSFVDSDLFKEDTSHLPPEVAALVRTPPSARSWVPEVYLNVLLLASIEQRALSEQQFIDSCYQGNKALLAQPLNRLLLLAASQEFVLKGVSSRFETFHKGIATSALPMGPKDWTITMSFRSHLMPEVVLKAYATAFQAALEGAGGKNVQSTLTESGPTHGTFRVKWTT